ncbi:MAG: cytochrome c biogenesis protein CcsA [Sphingobacteriales bacterium]|nr:cytochrome c biogenesis protein CcsA [Sphingobacteriales bacterium]
MKFEGEHLLPGQFGHFFVILALVAALVSAISFFLSSRAANETLQNSWLQFARKAFFLQGICILFVFGIIYYLCSQHYFEYMYVYKHASKELEPKYLLACIWEGQEGSFLLWAIWHAVLGSFFLLFQNSIAKRRWQAPVMTVISTAQFFLMLMILGVYIFNVRIGNSPFTLTRNEIAGPIFSQPNYLNFIKDGMGLNVLLRNYWMVIHPPVLFLGFASTIIPFAYAYAGIQTRLYGEWIKPVLPWALFSACILGVGIMMGGKWAYESLSFGGYWAWDPVENASLVPWLLLIAGLHTMVVYQATGHSLRASYLFAILCFVFILYSTFLTRTGILGDTSVHAFTEAGKAINVMIGLFVLFFTLPMLVLFFRHYKKIPAIPAEEATSSREFWMFIGSLVFFLSAVFIIAITSIPVYSKTPFLKDLIIRIHKGPLAMPENAEFLYNKVMVMVAIVIGLLTAATQYLKYKSSPKGYFLKKIVYPTLIASIITIIIAIWYPFTYHKQGAGFLGAIYTAFFATLYSVVANAMYIMVQLKGNLKSAGGSVAHAGFALMIAGMLISSSNKEVISDSRVNGINVPAGKDPMTKQSDDPRENLTLIRQVSTRMGRYEVTYRNDSSGHEKGRRFYGLSFVEKDTATKKVKSSFTLNPDVYIMKDNNMSSNPDTKSYLTKDIFTYISYALNEEKNQDTSHFTLFELAEGESRIYNNGYFVLNGVTKNPSNDKYHFTPNDAALMADITIVTKDSMRYRARPLIKVDGESVLQLDDTLYAQNLFVKFAGVGENRKIKIGIRESSTLIDFVTVKTYIFPYINLVWLGLIIMALGILLSMIRRAGMSTAKGSLVLLLASLGLIYMFLLAN